MENSTSPIWTKLYPKQVPQTINPDEYQNVIEIFNESLRKFRDKIAFENFDCGLTYGELDKTSDQTASYFQNTLNLKKGDRVAIQLPNVLQFPIVAFGALKAGLIVVNTNPLYTASEMKHQFNDSGATTIIILAQFAHLLEQVQAETKIKNIIVTQVGDQLPFVKKTLINFVLKKVKKMVPKYNLKHHTWSEILNSGAKLKHTQPDIKSSDIAFLQYTGGTTGVSKGAILTHRNIVANVLQICGWMKPKLIEGQEIAIAPLPLYHIFSLTVCSFAFMKYGAKNILITNPRDIPAFVKLLKKTPFSILTGVNTLYNALLNNPDFKDVDFSHLKISVAGAMALQKAVQEKWKKVTNTVVIEGYGLTETSPVACVNPVDGTERPGCIGIPVAGTYLKLVDDDGNDVTTTGNPGEILIKGPQVMQGYYNQPEETAKSIKDGWFASGDIGTMDPDGFFRIVDRKKDMILVSGFNVYPNEVEDVIALHPKVKEVAAIGVSDEHSGEIVKVFVVKNEDSLTEKEVIEFAKKSLTNYKVPKKVEFIAELPKTNVGKILRRALRDLK